MQQHQALEQHKHNLRRLLPERWRRGLGPGQHPLGPLAFGVAYLVPLLMVPGCLLGGLAWFSVPVFVFVLIPLLDALLGTWLYNPTAQETETLLASRGFQLMTWAYVPIQVGLVLWGAAHITSGSGFERIGMTVSIGICTGAIGINLAHELMHKTSRFERTLSQILLLMVCYMHFYIEHLRGHHRQVSTPSDPASARLGESFYRFYLRTVVGSWRDAWALERQRMLKKKLPWWQHQMYWFTLLPLLLATALYVAWGPAALGFYLAQSIVAFSLLEVVNYVEHYGLQRREIRPGVFEAVNTSHSWNSNHLLTNCFLFMLQRHSDHHAHQSRRYQILQQFDTSPQLPAGYATMILLALVPPLWRKVMDPKVEAYRAEE